MTSTAASSRDTAASMVVGCRSVTSFTWPPSAQAVTVPPSRPSTNASPPPTKNPRSSSSPSCGKLSQPSTLCSAIVLHGSRDPPEPTTQLLIPQIHETMLDKRQFVFAARDIGDQSLDKVGADFSAIELRWTADGPY